jgi:2-oxo-4-hydroxy-4-carboxy--5-ureidoimidazoline (OHCU) decarboxylase
MIDFDMKPREKSEEERAFDALNAEYTAKFGKPYVFDFASDAMTMEETLADIRRRIDSNTPQEIPAYKPGVLY